jgi:hypothetical protein
LYNAKIFALTSMNFTYCILCISLLAGGKNEENGDYNDGDGPGARKPAPGQRTEGREDILQQGLRVSPMRPKPREMTRHGGLPGLIEESGSAG